MIPDILTDFSVTVDDTTYIGKAEEADPPTLAKDLITSMVGGRLQQERIPAGIKPMELMIRFAGVNAQTLAGFGVSPGAPKLGFVLRGITRDLDGTVKGATCECDGFIEEIKPAKFKNRSGTGQQVKVAVSRFHWLEEGVSVLEIDNANYSMKTYGVEQLTAERAALGIS